MAYAAWRHLPILVLGLAGPVLGAEAGPTEDGLAWLKKMASASRQLNYTGAFVYRHGSQSETSRVSHYVNNAGGEMERLETLDGPVREVIRTNDQVVCYLPESRTVITEKRGKRRFPAAMLPEHLTGVTESYTVRMAGKDRVAGYDCNVVVLEPRDQLRYGHNYCAELGSGLPLRASTYNEKKQAVESFAFTEVRIGGAFDRDAVKSKYASKSRDWKQDQSALPTDEAPANTGWVLTQQPAGFKKLTEVKRSIAGRAGMVSHIVYSDGLAAVSVFIEPLPKAKIPPHLSHQGAVNIYTRPVADFMVTVLGEAPAVTVMQIANSLEFRGATPR